MINQPYYIDASKVKPKKPRYYQRIAINRVIDAIAQGKNRMLLVMATGERVIIVIPHESAVNTRASAA